MVLGYYKNSLRLTLSFILPSYRNTFIECYWQFSSNFWDVADTWKSISFNVNFFVHFNISKESIFTRKYCHCHFTYIHYLKRKMLIFIYIRVPFDAHWSKHFLLHIIYNMNIWWWKCTLSSENHYTGILFYRKCKQK